MRKEKKITELPLRALSESEQQILNALYEAEHSKSAYDVYFDYLFYYCMEIVRPHLDGASAESEARADLNLACEDRNLETISLVLKKYIATTNYILPSYQRIQRLLKNLVDQKLIASRKSIGAKTADLYYLPESTIKKMKEKKYGLPKAD
jgi:hypothetical protein